jgi:hypothetical protein
MLNSVLAVLIAIALLIPATVAAQAQQQAAKTTAKAWTPKKTSDGQPDIQGFWSTTTNVPLERPANCGAKEFYTPEELALPQAQRCPAVAPAAGAAAPAGRGGGAAAAGGGQRGGGGRGAGGQRGAATGAPQQATAADVHYDLAQFGLNIRTSAENNRTSLVTGPEGRIPPLSDYGRQRQAELQAAPRSNFDAAQNRPTTERCLIWAAQGPPLMSVGYNSNLQIVQGPGYVMIMPEMMQDARIIPLDGRPHAPEAVKTWSGDARGRWEGDTLVVETTNFNGRNPLRGVGSEKLVLTERFKRVNENTLLYEYTVNDPVWTKPWTVQVPWAQSQGPLFEYACHEGNYGMYNILSGARAAEKAAADAKK